MTRFYRSGIIPVMALCGAVASACLLDTSGRGQLETSGAAASTTDGTGASGGAGGGGTTTDEMGEGGSTIPVAADQCPGPEVSVAAYSSVELAGDTVLASNDTGSICGGGQGPDVVYQVIPAESGTLAATLSVVPPYKGLVHIRSDCQDPTTELGCGATDVHVTVVKDVPVFVLVDGMLPVPSGQFNLRLELDGCGNGVLEGDHEECDDGNVSPLDGCSSSCQVECDCPAPAISCAIFEDPATHHCYAMVAAPDAKWDEAISNCQSWGGTLAALATVEEIETIKASVIGDTWIGGSDLVVEGTFAWSNGEPWTYVNGEPPWAQYMIMPDEPNGGTAENCVELQSSGRLNDENCSTVQNYLCERPPIGP